MTSSLTHTRYRRSLGQHTPLRLFCPGQRQRPTPQKDSTGTTGNVMYLHLFMDALALQPCNPTCTFHLCVTGFVNEEFFFFAVVTARDAWI